MNITRTDVDDVAVLHLDGHLDSTTSPLLQAALSAAIAAGAYRVAIDLQKVSYVASAGLRVVLIVAKQIWALGGQFAAFGLANPVRETFEISGFAGIITIVGTEAEAISVAGGR